MNAFDKHDKILENISNVFSSSTLNTASLESSIYKTLRDYRNADYTYEVIMARIHDFEQTLDDEHEVGIMLASFGKDITLSVTSIEYSNPTTLVFHGYVGTQQATLIQHVSQLNFLLLAVKKVDPEKPPRRIGFVLPIED